MKTQGSFNYKVNGENKTKEEIDNMDLSNMNCTVDGLSVSYSFPAKKSFPKTKTCLEEIEKASLEKWLEHRLALPRTKTDDNKGGILKGSEFNEFSEKDDVITSSNRGEKEMIGKFKEAGSKERGSGTIVRFKRLENKSDSETIVFTEDVRFNDIRDVEKYGKDNNYDEWENLGSALIYDERKANENNYIAGIKETEGKLDYSEINFKLLDLMAKRFMDNKIKYPKGNSKKALDKNEILWAAFRHIRKMIDPIENDPETYEEHLSAVATNLSIILDQIDLEKSK